MTFCVVTSHKTTDITLLIVKKFNDQYKITLIVKISVQVIPIYKVIVNTMIS